MITLITGTPGAGKSLKAVHRIQQALDDGRQVYTDVDGIALQGVNVVDADHCWMDTPEGSLVVYDEAQKRWPSTGRPGHAPDEDIRALETHRHTGHDIIVITQHPTLIHHHVRKLVGEHIHVRRVSNAPVVTLFTLSECFDPADKRELRNTDKQTWKYPKSLFEAYKSATAHTHKFKLPAKFKYLGFGILGLVALVVFLFSQVSMFDFLGTEPQGAKREAGPAAARSLPLAHPSSGALPVQPPANVALMSALEVESMPVISGCLKTDDRCRCWNDDGHPMNTSIQQCELLLAEMPTALGGFKSSGRSAPSDDKQIEERDYDYIRNPPPDSWRVISPNNTASL